MYIHMYACIHPSLFLSLSHKLSLPLSLALALSLTQTLSQVRATATAPPAPHAVSATPLSPETLLGEMRPPPKLDPRTPEPQTQKP